MVHCESDPLTDERVAKTTELVPAKEHTARGRGRRCCTCPSLPLYAPPSRAARPLPSLPSFLLFCLLPRSGCVAGAGAGTGAGLVCQSDASRSRTERHTSMSSLLDFYGITSAASASGGGEDEPAGGAADEPRAKDDRKELASENFEAQVSKHSQQAGTTGCSLHRCPLSNCVSRACASRVCL
jgi:hypothetical protein